MAPRSYNALRARLPGIFAGFVLSMMTAGVVCADEHPVKSGLGALADHDHPPILVRSRPVIERLAVSVVEPEDLCVSVKGNIYIADRRAKVVFRLTPAGQTELAAAEIDGLSARLRQYQWENIAGTPLASMRIRRDSPSRLTVIDAAIFPSLCSKPTVQVESPSTDKQSDSPFFPKIVILLLSRASQASRHMWTFPK